MIQKIKEHFFTIKLMLSAIAIVLTGTALIEAIDYVEIVPAYAVLRY